MKKIDFDFSNIGGIQKMYAIPHTSFVQVREDVTSGRCYLDLTRREDIIAIYVIYDTAVFNEEQTRNAPGSSYEVSIAGIIPKASQANRQLLLQLENTPLFVLFQDYNDRIRLAGTKENPLTFTRKETTGTVNTRNQLAFEIKGRQAIPCYFIDPEALSYF